MEDFPAVAISQTTEQLEHEDLQDGGGGRGWILENQPASRNLDVVGRKNPWELSQKGMREMILFRVAVIYLGWQ